MCVFSGSHLQSEEKRNHKDNYPTGSDKSGVIQFQNDKPIRCKLVKIGTKFLTNKSVYTVLK